MCAAKALSINPITNKPMLIFRVGKTAKDHASGAWARRRHNQMARDAWVKDSKDKGGRGLPIDSFPHTTCNGKRNRHRFYAKGGDYVVLEVTKHSRRSSPVKK